MSGLVTMRSTTTSMSCLNFLSSVGASSIVELAVDLEPLEAGLLPLGDLLLVLALAAANDGRQQIETRAFRQAVTLVDHLADGLALDRQAGRRRIGHADARPEQAHVVVDLGDRADGRARVARRGLLLDRDGRRQALDQVDVRLAASSPGTGGHRPTGSRRSGAGPRHRSCRRPATTCPSPTGRSARPARRAGCRRRRS
jgi:hypothetical protein